MEIQPNPEIKGGTVVAAAVVLLLLALAACAPMPLEQADQGAAATGAQFAHNAGYHLGSDPAFPGGGKGSSP